MQLDASPHFSNNKKIRVPNGCRQLLGEAASKSCILSPRLYIVVDRFVSLGMLRIVGMWPVPRNMYLDLCASEGDLQAAQRVYQDMLRRLLV